MQSLLSVCSQSLKEKLVEEEEDDEEDVGYLK